MNPSKKSIKPVSRLWIGGAVAALALGASAARYNKNMEKDFDRWDEEKKRTNTEAPRLYTVREIWWRRLGVNVETEQNGSGEKFLRPVVILRGFGPDACLVVPLTTSTREHSLRMPIGLVDGQEARANLSQVRVVDTRRLVEKVEFLDKDLFVNLKKAARTLF